MRPHVVGPCNLPDEKAASVMVAPRNEDGKAAAVEPRHLIANEQSGVKNWQSR